MNMEGVGANELIANDATDMPYCSQPVFVLAGGSVQHLCLEAVCLWIDNLISLCYCEAEPSALWTQHSFGISHLAVPSALISMTAAK